MICTRCVHIHVLLHTCGVNDAVQQRDSPAVRGAVRDAQWSASVICACRLITWLGCTEVCCSLCLRWCSKMLQSQPAITSEVVTRGKYAWPLLTLPTSEAAKVTCVMKLFSQVSSLAMQRARRVERPDAQRFERQATADHRLRLTLCPQLLHWAHGQSPAPHWHAA